MARRTTPTLTAALTEYLEVREVHVAQTTLVNDRALLRKLIAELGAERQVHTLTAQQLERWFAGEAKRQKASSYNKVRTRVQSFVGFCTRRGWLTSDPLGEVRAQRVVKRERLRLSPTELVQLPDHTDNLRDRTFLVLATNTALRASEIVSIRLGDVDLDGGWLRVTISKSAVEDTMPVTVELDAALRAWLTEYAEQAGPLDPSWFLFPGRGAGRYSYSHGVPTYHYGELRPSTRIAKAAVLVQRALERSGLEIEAGEGVHTLRRSVARAFFDASCAAGHDAALRATSALLHHSSSQVTEHYLGLRQERLSRDNALRGKPFLTAMVAQPALRVAR